MLIARSGAVALLVSIALTSAFSLAVAQANMTPLKECILVHRAEDAGSARPAARPVFPPVQLDISTPFEPTLFPSGGLHYLVYELHVQNYTDAAMALRGIEVLDASSTTNEPIAAFTGSQLYERLLPIGADQIDSGHPLEGGKRAVVFICLAFADRSTAPATLRHRVIGEDVVAEGPVIGTRHTALKVLAPPVAGTDWGANNGPSIHSHHRTGHFVAGGQAQISRRYAIDWKQSRQGATFSADGSNVDSYYAYGPSVFAVTDATVISARDGLPDNRPRTAIGSSTAVPITMETVAGNAIVLDLGDGQFALYAHLKPGSVRVKAGDRVQRGDALASSAFPSCH